MHIPSPLTYCMTLEYPLSLSVGHHVVQPMRQQRRDAHVEAVLEGAATPDGSLLHCSSFYRVSAASDGIEMVTPGLSFRHLIFEYLPHKEKRGERSSPFAPSSPSASNAMMTADNSVIEKLLGRSPLCSSPPPSSLSNDAGLNLLSLLQPPRPAPDSSAERSVSILDRLHDAIRKANCNNSCTSANTADHRIAVQA